MHQDEASEVPDGAAVFPLIPAELKVHPLLLASLHATIFLAGSDEDLVEPTAADEAVERVAEYFRRLDGTELGRVQEDMVCLIAFAQAEKWPKKDIHLLKSFLKDLGVQGGPT